jgi:hypothetical protein
LGVGGVRKAKTITPQTLDHLKLFLKLREMLMNQGKIYNIHTGKMIEVKLVPKWVLTNLGRIKISQDFYENFGQDCMDF